MIRLFLIFTLLFGCRGLTDQERQDDRSSDEFGDHSRENSPSEESSEGSGKDESQEDQNNPKISLLSSDIGYVDRRDIAEVRINVTSLKQLSHIISLELIDPLGCETLGVEPVRNHAGQIMPGNYTAYVRVLEDACTGSIVLALASSNEPNHILEKFSQGFTLRFTKRAFVGEMVDGFQPLEESNDIDVRFNRRMDKDLRFFASGDYIEIGSLLVTLGGPLAAGREDIRVEISGLTGCEDLKIMRASKGSVYQSFRLFGKFSSSASCEFAIGVHYINSFRSGTFKTATVILGSEK